MEHIRRSAASTGRRLVSLSKSQDGVRSLLGRNTVSKFFPDVGFAGFSSCARKDVLGAKAISDLLRRHQSGALAGTKLSLQNVENYSRLAMSPYARSFASNTSRQARKAQSEQAKKEVSTVEDPFDPLTYNIPEKPVTFTEGASYSVIILVGLGLAAAAAYAVFKELIFEPKEYKVFNKALKRIQDDSQVRVRIGQPITGYGQESRNRAARQRIPNKIYTDEDGVEHVEVNFFVRGPHGAGKVFANMFKDPSDKEWKYTYLIVHITSPSEKQLMLESYLPAYEPAPRR